MDKTAAAAAVNAVTVNLPTSWREQPELWFAQAEGQFRLRGIIDENTKFDHVITLLNAITAANVSDLMRNGKMKKNKKLDRRPKNPGTRCSVGHRGCSPPPVAWQGPVAVASALLLPLLVARLAILVLLVLGAVLVVTVLIAGLTIARSRPAPAALLLLLAALTVSSLLVAAHVTRRRRRALLVVVPMVAVVSVPRLVVPPLLLAVLVLVVAVLVHAGRPRARTRSPTLHTVALLGHHALLLVHFDAGRCAGDRFDGQGLRINLSCWGAAGGSHTNGRRSERRVGFGQRLRNGTGRRHRSGGRVGCAGGRRRSGCGGGDGCQFGFQSLLLVRLLQLGDGSVQQDSVGFGAVVQT